MSPFQNIIDSCLKSIIILFLKSIIICFRVRGIMFSFKILDNEDLYQQQELMQYAFNSESNNYENISIEEYEKYYKPVTFLGIYDNQILASTLIIISFHQRIRGTSLPMAGIAGVATKPEYRRKGLVTKLFKELFLFCNENNIPISTLFPFKISYYEQFGYVWVENLIMLTGWTVEIKKQDIGGYRIEEEKNFERAIDRMRPLYKKSFLSTNGLLDRDVTTNAFQKRLNKGFYFFSIDEHGNDTGYIVVWFVEKDTLGIREFIAPDIQTRKNLWNFIKLHEGHKKYFTILDYLSHTIQTYPYIKEPRVKKVEITPNAMLRIINVEETLLKVQYPSITESITIRVHDELCDWNTRTWDMSITQGKVTITETEKIEAEVNIDIMGLAQLIAGFRNTTELEEQELISGNKDSYDKLDKIFPKDWFIVRDFF